MQLAQVISYITTPWAVWCVGVAGLIMGAAPAEAGAALIFLVAGGFLPLLVWCYEYLTSKRLGAVKRELRYDIYLGGVVTYSAIAVLFGTQAYPNNTWMALSVASAVFFGLFMLVNAYFDKASLHIGTYLFWVLIWTNLLNPYWGLASLLLPIIMWSRLKIKKHTWEQLMWGMVIGGVAALITWL